MVALRLLHVGVCRGVSLKQLPIVLPFTYELEDKYCVAICQTAKTN